MKKFRIGLFTSAWDLAALNLVRTVIDNVKNGLIPNAEICFVLVSRASGETGFGDLMIKMVRDLGVPLITFPSLQFKPGLRKLGRQEEKKGNKTTMEDWRCFHDQNLQKLIVETDLDVLLGYMWTVSERMCLTRNMINLHPALPGGPKGTFKEVIRHLINTSAEGTGVMMHHVAPEVDEGSAISFCRYSIRGIRFDSLRRGAAGKPESDEGSLFQAIRQAGVIRELPLVVWTIKVLAEEKISIKNGNVMNADGKIFIRGYDLTRQIDAEITASAKSL